MKALTFLEWQKQKLFDIYHNGAECRRTFNNDSEILDNYIAECGRINKVVNFYGLPFKHSMIGDLFGVKPNDISHYINLAGEIERTSIGCLWLNTDVDTLDEFLNKNKKFKQSVDFKPEIVKEYFT